LASLLSSLFLSPSKYSLFVRINSIGDRIIALIFFSNVSQIRNINGCSVIVAALIHKSDQKDLNIRISIAFILNAENSSNMIGSLLDQAFSKSVRDGEINTSIVNFIIITVVCK